MLWALSQALDCQKNSDHGKVSQWKQRTGLKVVAETLRKDFSSLLRQKLISILVSNLKFETSFETSENQNTNVWVWKTKTVQIETTLQADNLIW